MKLILIVVLICVIMLIAFSVSEQYREKYNFYQNLIGFLQQFRMNLNFKQQTIINFIDNVKAKKQFKIFISHYKTFLKTNEIDLSDIKVLEYEEKLELIDMIKNIGRLDVENETKQIDIFINNIENKLLIAGQEKKKLCPMIIKLSLLFSIGIAILLI